MLSEVGVSSREIVAAGYTYSVPVTVSAGNMILVLTLACNTEESMLMIRRYSCGTGIIVIATNSLSIWYERLYIILINETLHSYSTFWLYFTTYTLVHCPLTSYLVICNIYWCSVPHSWIMVSSYGGRKSKLEDHGFGLYANRDTRPTISTLGCKLESLETDMIGLHRWSIWNEAREGFLPNMGLATTPISVLRYLCPHLRGAASYDSELFMPLMSPTSPSLATSLVAIRKIHRLALQVTVRWTNLTSKSIYSKILRGSKSLKPSKSLMDSKATKSAASSFVETKQEAPRPVLPAAKPKDGGYFAWLQCAGSFCLFLNSWGLVNSFGPCSCSSRRMIHRLITLRI